MQFCSGLGLGLGLGLGNPNPNANPSPNPSLNPNPNPNPKPNLVQLKEGEARQAEPEVGRGGQLVAWLGLGLWLGVGS